MKIEKIVSYLVHRYLLVRVYTDEGIVGTVALRFCGSKREVCFEEVSFCPGARCRLDQPQQTRKLQAAWPVRALRLVLRTRMCLAECARPRAQRQAKGLRCSSFPAHSNMRKLLWPRTATLR
jgi:hypothetical protein